MALQKLLDSFWQNIFYFKKNMQIIQFRYNRLLTQQFIKQVFEPHMRQNHIILPSLKYSNIF